jgi:lysophospholipid acyltransferase (LPLAT)-like uncharacterized protein
MPETRKKSMISLKGHRHLPSPLYWTLAAAVKLFRTTYRVQVVDQAGLLEKNAANLPAILVNWHNRLVFMPSFVPAEVRSRITVLASDSRDGEYAAQYMGRFGLRAVRGSTSKGGHRALVQMRKALQEDWSIALTPDGPRGPKYHVHPGAVMLAEMTKCPIIPLGFNASSRWELGGWDRTQIPKPFARVEVRYGEPMFIADSLDAKQRAEKIEELKQRMLDITVD